MKTDQKRATIYLDAKLHQALKIKAAQSNCSISELVNAAIRQNLAEDLKDLSAIEARKDEPSLDFEDVLKALKADGYL